MGLPETAGSPKYHSDIEAPGFFVARVPAAAGFASALSYITLSGGHMPLFEWNYTFVLGIKEIDQQHQLLVGLVQRVYEEWKGGATAVGLQSTLRVLLLHARCHFDLEERWMEETAYPERDEHKKAHDAFKDAVLGLHPRAREAPESVLEDILFLQNWVWHHIADTDAEFIKYLVSSNKWASKVTIDLPIHLMIQKYLSS